MTLLRPGAAGMPPAVPRKSSTFSSSRATVRRVSRSMLTTHVTTTTTTTLATISMPPAPYSGPRARLNPSGV